MDEFGQYAYLWNHCHNHVIAVPINSKKAKCFFVHFELCCCVTDLLWCYSFAIMLLVLCYWEHKHEIYPFPNTHNRTLLTMHPIWHRGRFLGSRSFCITKMLYPATPIFSSLQLIGNYYSILFIKWKKEVTLYVRQFEKICYYFGQ